MRRALRVLLALLALLALAPVAQAQTAWSVDALMHALSQNPGGKARFVERKYLALLEAPIESTGELVYKAPDRLERHAFTPKRESMVLEGNTLTLDRESGRLHMDLRDYPDAAALIESIRSTLAGDRAALERNYRLGVSGTRAAWTLDLSPSDAKIAERLLRIRIEGHDGRIDTVEILLADGDRSVMHITPTP